MPLNGATLQSSRNRAQRQHFSRELVSLLPKLRQRALGLCKNRSDAEDVLHETFVRALEFQDSYEDGTNLRAWVQQILFTVFISRCRRLQRERRALDALSADPCAWTRPEGAPPMRALTAKVQGAIDSLPQQFAAAVRLVDLHELSYKEAARELGVPIGTVMSRLFRGRRLLAGALTDAVEPTKLLSRAAA